MTSYIVLVSPSYGGAEKRFFDIFTALRREGGDVRLVGPTSLIQQFRTDHAEDRADILDALVEVGMPTPWSRIRFIRKFRRVLATLPKGSHFHYPLNCLWPLHVWRGDRVTMTVADCKNVPGPFAKERTSVWSWVCFHFVVRIDVLSPAILHDIDRSRAAGRMSLTPGGTFLVPLPAPTVTKTPTVVFLGRLVPLKGVIELLDVLEDVWTRMAPTAPVGSAFRIAGYGSLEAQVARRCDELKQRGVPVEFIGYASASALMAGASVVLSLQDSTNYPSRVVAEALMSSCAAIVRDTGDSRLFGEEVPGLSYCHANLDPIELAGLLSHALSRVVTDAAYRASIRAAALERFSAPSYIDYFRDVIGVRSLPPRHPSPAP